jgi:hypothetical protein
MLKKLTILAAALAVSAPAFADRGHRGHDRHDRRVVVHKHHYVQHRPAPVVHHYYRPAPRPVVVVQQRPHYNPNGAALVVGAVLGAAIVHSVITSGY